MPALVLLAIQIGFAFAAYAVLASALAPWLRTLPRPRALELLLWTHVPRAAPLGLLAPGQVEGVAPAVTNTIAWGDFSSAALALIAIVAIRSRGERALGLVWAFTVVSCLDIVVALTTALGHGVHESSLGFGWYVLTLYVPLVCVSQLLIGQALVHPPGENSMTLRQLGFRVTTTLAVLVFAGSGIAMLVRHEHIAADMRIMGYPAFLLSILGAWKLLAAVTVALPGLPRLKEWAYAGMVFDLTGAALSRVLGGFGGEHLAPPMMICAAVLVSWALRPASRRLANPGEAPRGLRFPVHAR